MVQFNGTQCVNYQSIEAAIEAHAEDMAEQFDKASGFEHFCQQLGRLVGDGRIMVVEWIPDNYPAVGIFTYESKTEYAESVNEVNWVTEHSNINDEELAETLVTVY
jgi:hypothetical protein